MTTLCSGIGQFEGRCRTQRSCERVSQGDQRRLALKAGSEPILRRALALEAPTLKIAHAAMLAVPQRWCGCAARALPLLDFQNGAAWLIGAAACLTPKP